MWWNSEKPEVKIQNVVYNYPMPKRNKLFPKLQTIINQAELHYNAGDLDLCKDILNLMWRTIDKAEEDMKSELENIQNDPLRDFVKESFSTKESVGEKPEFPTTPTKDTNNKI